MTDYYKKLFCRNADYVPYDLQNKIKNTSILIAGCGIGSSIAEAAVRIGFEEITLIDGDKVALHNLNRQFYVQDDVGEFKVNALAKRLKSINPNVSVTVVNDWVTAQNAKEFASKSDFIFDTIDFLDINAITMLHDAANQQKKPIISAMNIGWGAGAMYCPPSESKVCYFRKIFRLPDTGELTDLSYVMHFKVLIEKIGKHLNPEVIVALSKAFQIMEDGKPCPASQVSPGSFSVASLVITLATKILSGQEVTQAPNMILVNVNGACEEAGINLLEE